MTAPSYAHDPANCAVCGRHALGVGLEPAKRGEEPRYLCAECLTHLEYIKSVRRFDPYEIKAAKMAGEQAGALLDQWDKTDLGALSEEEWGLFCRTMCQSFGDSMRQLIRNGEAPW